MPLTMRPTGLGSGFYKDDVDYSVFCGEWCIGRIYEKHSSPQHLRWFWSLFCTSKPGEMRTSNQVATLEVAKAEFRGELETMEGMGKDGRSTVARAPRIVYAGVVPLGASAPPHAGPFLVGIIAPERALLVVHNLPADYRHESAEQKWPPRES